MDIQVIVDGQRLKVYSRLKFFAPRSQEFVKFIFELSEDWDGLTVFAQFRQNNKAYNQFLNRNGEAYLPHELSAGKCTLMLYGSGSGNKIGTTNCLELNITENILLEDADSTGISKSLYDQLVEQVNALSGLDEEQIRAYVEGETATILDEYLSSGKLSAMTIQDGTITRAKLDSDVTSSLLKADSAMQPSVYDVQGLQTDVFEYAKARANEVKTSLESSLSATNSTLTSLETDLSDLDSSLSSLKTEIESARDFDGSTYETLSATITAI